MEAESDTEVSLSAAKQRLKDTWLAMALACITAGCNMLRDAPEYCFLCFACVFSPGKSALEEDGKIDYGSDAWAKYCQVAYALGWLRPKDRTTYEEQVEDQWAEDAYIERGGGN